MSFLVFLLENKAISDDIYEIAANSGYITSENLTEFLLSATDLSEEAIAILKAKYYGLDYIPDSDLLHSNCKNISIDHQTLKEANAIPYRISKDTQEIEIATYDPDNIIAMDDIKKAISHCQQTKNFNISFKIGKKSTITSLLKKQKSSSKPINNLIEQIILEAIEQTASDIHISPYENTCEIKYRIDGSLRTVKIVPIHEFQTMCVTIKVMTKLDISETRRPQSVHFQQDNIDFRVSTHPTIYGENICIRILNRNKSYIDITKLGFSSEQVCYLKKISQSSHGMIIFCGPTGSGKTTSIYSMLATINKQEKNIMTLEDPIEYKIHGVKQTEFREGVINFASGVKSILRQDPDIIFIGEIRDKETAQVAIRASMTGHLVFTTLHANDSIGAIKRFQDFDVSSFLVADNIIAIISQRLVKASGGGRTIISEILHIDPTINELIYKNATKHEILNYLKTHQNFQTLYDDCMNKIKSGILDETSVKNIVNPL